MIVCPQPQAAEAGLEVLREGGNAVDAAVTAAFVQGVVDPHMCGIGGCGVMTVHLAATGHTEVIEFYARAGSRARPDQWTSIFIRESQDGYGYVVEGAVNEVGYQSVGVPTNYDSYFARPQVIWISDGAATGASDPRGDGGVALTR